MRSLAKQRRETAEKDLSNTVVKQSVCVLSLLIFGVLLLSVPVCQFVSEIGRGKFSQFSGAVALFSNPKREAFEEYEDTLENESLLTNWLLPNVQTLMTGLLRTGNEQVYLGSEGWLFYRADVDSLITVQTDNSDKMDKVDYPLDAFEAIVDFKHQLKARNISLIVMPTPVKPSIHPDKFSVRHQHPSVPIQNPAYAGFVEALASQGVLVYDPSLILFEAARTDTQYLKTDTHWKPDAMERVAQDLAGFITQHVEFGKVPESTFTKSSVMVTNLGDIAKMLNLRENQNLFPQESVTTHVIKPETDDHWQSDRNAEVLFLGDSFSNIYSLVEMGWGESAGFVEHLSAELSRPVDKNVINAGVLTTRQTLMKEPERLNGKRVVVYQFASREIFSGDWKLLQIPETPSYTDPAVEKPIHLEDVITVMASIKDKTVPPVPGTVPYSDCIIAIHLEKINAPELPEEFVVFMWGMRDNKWTDAARYKDGQKVKLRVRQWTTVQGEYESYNRKELDNEDTWLLDVYWGEEP